MMTESELPRQQQEITQEAAPEYSAEKNPAQREILKRAMLHIQEHMEALGVPFHGYNENDFIFSEEFNVFQEGEYIFDNYVIIPPDAEANFNTIIHEALHYISSEYYINGIDETLQTRTNSRTSPRSGFTRQFYQKPTENSPLLITTPLRNLTESITEKTAREIVSKNIKELEALRPLFTGRKEKRLEQLSQKMDALKRKDEMELAEQREHIEKEIAKEIEEIKLTGKSQEEIEKLANERKRQIEESMAVFRRMQESFRFHSAFLERIENGYSFTPERIAYNNEIEILDTLLKGLALARSKKENLPVEEAQMRVWEEMQRAYLTGSVMHLRIIDKVFGEGTLREFNDLKSSGDQGNEAREKFLSKLNEQIGKLEANK